MARLRKQFTVCAAENSGGRDVDKRREAVADKELTKEEERELTVQRDKQREADADNELTKEEERELTVKRQWGGEKQEFNRQETSSCIFLLSRYYKEEQRSGEMLPFLSALLSGSKAYESRPNLNVHFEVLKTFKKDV